MKINLVVAILFVFNIGQSIAQNKITAEVPAQYSNPVLHADYSDPDAIRVGNTYIMTASSFTCTPGLPILTSHDLVHWTISGYALKKLVPDDYYQTVRHGGGVWAPSIRYHNNEFFIYYPDPDFGIYMVHAKSYLGPWSDPVLVQAGKGLIDPCPFWDDNGKAYLVHAYAGSRAGIKSIISIKQMNAEGTKVTDEGRIVYDGHGVDPTVEGPKIYKRNGFFYIFVPAGGVGTGWQTVLCSKNIYGPFERKVVMAQGGSSINGPHQGAWVQTPEGKDWFLHFQDKEAYGRVVHLQPMIWKNNWPVIGEDKDGDGTGEPFMNYGNKDTGYHQLLTQVKSSQFSGHAPLGADWQWQANAAIEWYFLHDQQLRLYARTLVDAAKNKYDLPNLLMQKFPALRFEATTKLEADKLNNGEEAGMMVFGTDYAWLGVQRRDDKFYLVQSVCLNADKGNAEKMTILDTLSSTSKLVTLKIVVGQGATVRFNYSWDGSNFMETKLPFTAKPGKWVGAKMGLFASGSKRTNDCGSADFDFFEVKY